MMPHEQLLVNRLKDQPFALLGIDLDETRTLPLELVNQKKITWRNWWDSDGTIAHDWAIEGLPTLYILDQQGVIRFANNGYMKPEDLNRVIDNLLKGQDVQA